MDGLIAALRDRLADNGQSFKWFHRTYMDKVVSYNYFIVQINDDNRLQDNVRAEITRFLAVPAVPAEL